MKGKSSHTKKIAITQKTAIIHKLRPLGEFLYTHGWQPLYFLHDQKSFRL